MVCSFFFSSAESGFERRGKASDVEDARRITWGRSPCRGVWRSEVTSIRAQRAGANQTGSAGRRNRPPHNERDAELWMVSCLGKHIFRVIELVLLRLLGIPLVGLRVGVRLTTPSSATAERGAVAAWWSEEETYELRRKVARSENAQARNSSYRDTRSRSLQRMVRRCGHLG